MYMWKNKIITADYQKKKKTLGFIPIPNHQ